MKPIIIGLSTVAIAIALSAPANAQTLNLPPLPRLNTESQDFFLQGREQFEKEIQFIMLKRYFPDEDLLKIHELPPLEDGPFSVEELNGFSDLVGQSPRAVQFN